MSVRLIGSWLLKPIAPVWYVFTVKFSKKIPDCFHEVSQLLGQFPLYVFFLHFTPSVIQCRHTSGLWVNPLVKVIWKFVEANIIIISIFVMAIFFSPKNTLITCSCRIMTGNFDLKLNLNPVGYNKKVALLLHMSSTWTHHASSSNLICRRPSCCDMTESEYEIT